MEIYICVGSSCHLKGSYDIIQYFQNKVREFGLEEDVVLKASFCMGRCTDGVAVKIDEDYIDGVNTANMAEVFNEYVLKRMKQALQNDLKP